MSGKLSLLPLTMLVTGNMMGAGIFLLPSSLASYGSITLLGWIVTVIGSVFLSLVFVRLGADCKQGAGLYAFTQAGLGRYVGSQVVYGYWAATWIGNIAVALSGVGYLSYFFPVLNGPWETTFAAIGVIWILSLINLTDIRLIGRLQIVTTCCMLVPVVIVSTLGWSQFEADNITRAFNVTGQPSRHVLSESVTLTLWSFIGLESACNLAGHARNPRWDVPCATLLGTLLAALFYILSTTAMMGVVPNEVLQSSAAPFSVTARYLLGDWAGEMVSVMAVIACFGSLNGWILMHSQVARAASSDGLLPRAFGVLNRYGSPWKGLLITGILMSALILLTVEPTIQKHFEFIVFIAVYIMLLAYFCACLSCFQIQRRKPGGLSAGWFMVILVSACYCLLGINGAGYTVFFYGTVLLILGSSIYWYQHRGNKKPDPLKDPAHG
ncbi:amino acid permease [Endozoicomonas numazuensis]|uniref:amino acid permease n=1 Tax=Endozoicomonas numazuensis TaxID=1137799 RepID=UPI000A979538|nr:amino acid permease [Endozoicomonas numazuensis]